MSYFAYSHLQEAPLITLTYFAPGSDVSEKQLKVGENRVPSEERRYILPGNKPNTLCLGVGN